MPDEGSRPALDEVFRAEHGPALATLIKDLGDFQLAEDALQEAFTAAVATWATGGMPRSPRAWLLTTARRRAIDAIRHNRSLAERAQRLERLIEHADEPEVEDVVHDDQLRLIFTCCHPALSPDARVALTLRAVGGLTTEEIARGFLVPSATMGKRIVRAKRKIADAHIPYRIPDAADLPARRQGVLRVLYLIFNEGYTATTGDRLVRHDLCHEARRLAALLCELTPRQAEAWGLLALMCLHSARLDARTDRAGRYVPLEQQDVGSWDRDLIERGGAALRRSRRLGPVGEYQLQAAITALHLEGAMQRSTDWVSITSAYRSLVELTGSPVVRVNHAAAVSFAHGPHEALRLLEPLRDDPSLARYQPLWATLADVLRRAGDTDGARRAYGTAIELSGNSVETEELRARLADLE